MATQPVTAFWITLTTGRTVVEFRERFYVHDDSFSIFDHKSLDFSELRYMPAQSDWRRMYYVH